MTETERTAPPAPGIYYDVPMDVYRAWGAINYSSISKGRKSMRAMHHAMTHSSKATAAQGLGTAVHAAILEPDMFEAFPVFDGTRRVKAFKTFEDENGCECITRDEKETAARLALIVHEDVESRHLVRASKHEVCMVWESPEYGLAKQRLDMLGNAFVADVKSARDVAIREIEKAIHSPWGWGYYLQFGWALEGLQNLGENIGMYEGYLIAVETAGDVPDAYAARINKDLMLRGQADAVRIAKEYHTCFVLNHFYGVARDGVPEIAKPHWMQIEDGDGEKDLSTGTMEAAQL